ncbi:predicted protein [Histoplasma mississippiense (nom. inval.)]|uniref:predicted protein n=1 Tax=Ajellomyces capsulatus (strain NAm1 / WU24) TaxID=2059318 RepID=UPI000157C34A|nr:predicted protein [Histoplasma mississippiense (nom. inval.)]EDN07463.1 predicted protein [Histoplasma mississippiense (nom. inval.)]
MLLLLLLLMMMIYLFYLEGSSVSQKAFLGCRHNATIHRLVDARYLLGVLTAGDNDDGDDDAKLQLTLKPLSNRQKKPIQWLIGHSS